MTAMPVPVFCAVGAGAWGSVQDLRSRPEIRLVSSPRHAAVLLEAGRVAGAHAEALDRVHDQMPHPRATVTWTGSEPVVDAVTNAFARLRADPSGSEPDRLPDQEPNEWRGVGPFGQGGEGMMGGTPYGRPMAMTGDDRDGLALDQLRLRLGPFVEWLPPGVTLDVTLQGEVVQEMVPDLPASTVDDVEQSHGLAGDRPELDDLRWLSWALHLHRLEAVSVSAARLATDDVADVTAERFERLRRSVRRSGLLRTVCGVGRIDGLGDASDRWNTRLDRIAASIAGVDPEPPEHEHVHLAWTGLAAATAGMTLTDVVTTVVSLQDRLVTPLEELAAS